MVRTLQSANLAARFVIELCAVGLVSYWGFRAFAGPVASVTVGVAAPLVLVVAWGLLASPRAPVSLSPTTKMVVQMVLLLVPALGLLHLGRPVLSGAFAAVVVANAALLGKAAR